jgi:hypothetical protein
LRIREKTGFQKNIMPAVRRKMILKKDLRGFIRDLTSEIFKNQTSAGANLRGFAIQSLELRQ